LGAVAVSLLPAHLEVIAPGIDARREAARLALREALSTYEFAYSLAAQGANQYYRNTMAIRLKDVAAELGISISTVNAALQGRSDISRVTRERVWKKASDLGYRPNWVARSLVTQKTNVLGVVVPDLSRAFFSEVIKGIDAVAGSAGYHLLLCNTGEDPTREDEEVWTLVSKQVDGLIIASAHSPGMSDVWKRLDKSKVPIVLIDRFFPNTHFVGCDDQQIGFIATDHLIKEGYKSIAHIRGPNVSTAIGRLKGYIHALRKNGRSVKRTYVIEAHYHDEVGGFEAMETLLRLSCPPDAVFAASDPIAIGALDAARKHGLSLPADFGLIGVGNMRYGQYLIVPLSTVDQQRGEIGSKAATLLIDLIDGKASRSDKPVLLQPRLVIRNSSSRKHGGDTGHMV
jgi:LacI family transcriptional regulator